MPSCYQTRVINAPIEKVWETIKCFHDLSWTPNVVESCEKVGELKGDVAGAQRLLNGVFEETLLSIDKENYIFTYAINEGISPVSSKEVSNYIGKVKLYPITQTDETFMEWESSWEAKTIDGEAFCHTLYVAMMADLNKSLSKEQV